MSNYNNIGEYNFAIIRGNSAVQTFQNWTVDGVPLNLDTVDVRVHLKTSIDTNRYPDLEMTKENGMLTVSGSSMTLHFGENTIKLQQNKYYYDILIVQGDTRNTYVRGIVTLSGVVTK